eukprot:2571926-Ditylum_brightwellii.AAC.1
MENATMPSWRQTELHPFNPNCEGWSVALRGLGLITKFEQDKNKTKSLISDCSYEIRVRDY